MNLRKLVVFLVIFGFVAAAFADDGPKGPESESKGPSSHHDDEDDVKREFKFTVQPEKIEVEVKLENGKQESKLKHKILATDSGVEFRVAYEQESGDTESELRLRVRLFELVEYIPDGTPGYQNEGVSNAILKQEKANLLSCSIQKNF